MNTLVIYDETGAVIGTMTGKEYGAVGTAVVEVPDGYEVTGVNVETGEAILTDKAATEAERTAAIERQMMQAAAGHEGSYEDPIPFVYGMAVETGKHYSFGGEIYIWSSGECPACVWMPDSGIWEWRKAADPEASGAADDPVPAERGMEYTYGLYYLDPEDDGIYLCTRAGEEKGGKVVLQYLPHELVGQYFEVM